MSKFEALSSFVATRLEAATEINGIKHERAVLRAKAHTAAGIIADRDKYQLKIAEVYRTREEYLKTAGNKEHWEAAGKILNVALGVSEAKEEKSA